MSLFSSWIRKVESEVESALTFAEPIEADIASAKAIVERLLSFVNSAAPVAEAVAAATKPFSG
jgi:hypothetical protein